MPNITSAGTYTKADPGFGFLAAKKGERSILFAGTSVGTALTLGYKDDTNTDQVLEGGTITALPTSKIVKADRDLQIVVTGSPNFNVSGA